jgi:hypothetical protein
MENKDRHNIIQEKKVNKYKQTINILNNENPNRLKEILEKQTENFIKTNNKLNEINPRRLEINKKISSSVIQVRLKIELTIKKKNAENQNRPR